MYVIDNLVSLPVGAIVLLCLACISAQNGSSERWAGSASNGRGAGWHLRVTLRLRGRFRASGSLLNASARLGPTQTRTVSTITAVARHHHSSRHSPTRTAAWTNTRAKPSITPSNGFTRNFTGMHDLNLKILIVF